MQYDAWGNLWKRTDFNGKTTTFAYDTINRLTSKTADPTHPSLIYSHAIARVEYDYDANGARIAARTYSAGNTLLYSEATPRDERGHLISKTTPFGTLGYDYYANGLLKDVVSSNSGGVNTGYRYDEANRLAFVDDASGVQPIGTPNRTTGYTYNANGSLQSVAAANGVTHTYQYDTLNRLRTLNVSNLSSQILGSYTYALNPSGHRHQITEGTGRTVAYTYDALYRLTSETVVEGADPGQNGTVTYGLDKVGNRESRTSSVTTIASSSNTFNSRDWLSGDTYDSNGNTHTTPLTALGSPLTLPDIYDFEDRLIVRTRSDGTTINLSYDADGIRLQKSIFDVSASLVSATGYFVDTNNLTGYAQVLEEYANTSAGTTASIYTYGSSPISVGRIIPNAPSSTFSYFTFDGLGSVRALTNSAGVVTDTYDYDAFGILIRRTGTTTNNYLYRGEQFDPDLGMYSLRARFYNQSTGRFWNQDSYEGSSGDPASLHKYLYAESDPIKFGDPSGNSILDYLGLGRAVHAELERLYMLDNPRLRYSEKYISTIANRANFGKKISPLRRAFGTSLGLRVDMGSFEGNGEANPYVIFDIKSYLEIPEGEAQIEGYLGALALAAPDVNFAAGSSANWPEQPHFIIANGYRVIVMPPINGVIAYISPEHSANTIQGAVTIYGLFAAFRAISAASSQAAVGELAGQAALEVAAGGF